MTIGAVRVDHDSGDSNSYSITPTTPAVVGDTIVLHIQNNDPIAPTQNDSWDLVYVNDPAPNESAYETILIKTATASEPVTYSGPLNQVDRWHATLHIIPSTTPLIVDLPPAFHWQSVKSGNMVCGAANGRTVAANSISIIVGNKDRQDTAVSAYTTADNSYTGVAGSGFGQMMAAAHRIYTAQTLIDYDVTIGNETRSDNTFSSHLSLVEPGGVLSMPVNQVTSNNTAQPVAAAPGGLQVPVGIVSGVSVAQSIAAGLVAIMSVGQVAGTGVAQAIFPGNDIDAAINQVSSVNFAQTVLPIPGFTPVAVFQVTETASAQSISPLSVSGAAVAQIAGTGLAQSINPLPGTGQFHKTFTADFANLPANSFAIDQGLSAILTGDGYQMDLLTSPDNHPVSGSGLGVITVTGAVTQQQTINYTIYDLSDGSVGSAGTITVDVTALNVALNTAVETSSAQAITPLAGGLVVPVGQAADASTANSIAPQFGGSGVTVSGAVEVDASQPINSSLGGQFSLLGGVIELGSPQSINALLGALSVPVGQSSDTDTALGINTLNGLVVPIGQAIGTDSTLAVFATMGAVAVPVGHVVENDIAQVIASLGGQVAAPIQIVASRQRIRRTIQKIGRLS